MRGLHKHIPSGKIVLIDHGQYQVNGRVSNHFSGRVLDKDGLVTDEIFGDYNVNGIWKKVKKYKIFVQVEND